MTSEKFRPSKKKPWHSFLISLCGMLLITFALSFNIANEEISETESVFNAGLFFIVFFSAIAVYSSIALGIAYGIYRKERFYFEENKLNYELTFIMKKRVSLPLEKINIVKIKRDLFDLILGTSRVEIGSGSMTTSLKAEIRLCLDKEFAEYFADYLQRYSKAVKENKEFTEALSETDMNEVSMPEKSGISVAMDTKDRIKYILTSPLIIGSVLSAAFIAGIFFGVNKLNPQAAAEATYKDDELAITIIACVLPIIGIISALFRAFVSFYGYKAEKTEDGIRISYGLISKKSFFVTFDKIHGYVISRSLLRQFFGLGSLKLCVVGMDEQQGQNNALAETYLYPCGNVKKLKEIMDTLLPSYKFEGILNKSVKKSAIHTILIPTLTAMILPLPLLLYLSVKVSILMLLIPYACILLGIIRRYMVYKYAAFGLSGDFLCAKSGGFTKNYSVIKTNSVQEISTHAGFIRRKHEICSYNIVYRGSNVFSSRIIVRNVPKIDLKELI